MVGKTGAERERENVFDGKKFSKGKAVAKGGKKQERKAETEKPARGGSVPRESRAV